MKLEGEQLIFCERWTNSTSVDYINQTMRSIRKVQNDCSLLNICTTDRDLLEKSHTGKFHDADSLNKAKLVDILQELIDSKIEISPLIISGKWCEIDTPMDLERAKKIFKNIDTE